MKTWKNIDNSIYYETVPFETQYNYSQIAGVSTYYDLDYIKKYIFKSKSLLEVGACYGRVIDYLALNRYNGAITAIERSEKFYSILNEKYSSFATLINCDIKNFKPKNKFDLILWLWCGISDFTLQEQPKIIRRLLNILTPDGILIVESLAATEEVSIAKEKKSQSYKVEINGANLYGYIPNSLELNSYADKIGAQLVIKPYKTPNGRSRQFNIFSHMKTSRNITNSVI